MRNDGSAFWCRKALALCLRVSKQLHEPVGDRSLP